MPSARPFPRGALYQQAPGVPIGIMVGGTFAPNVRGRSLLRTRPWGAEGSLPRGRLPSLRESKTLLELAFLFPGSLPLVDGGRKARQRSTRASPNTFHSFYHSCQRETNPAFRLGIKDPSLGQPCACGKPSTAGAVRRSCISRRQGRRGEMNVGRPARQGATGQIHEGHVGTASTRPWRGISSRLGAARPRLFCAFCAFLRRIPAGRFPGHLPAWWSDLQFFSLFLPAPVQFEPEISIY
jgi:hypothetical protein